MPTLDRWDALGSPAAGPGDEPAPSNPFSVVAADLIDEAVGERFRGVEVTPAPHVLGDLLGRPTREVGEAGMEPPAQLLLLATVRRDLVWRPGELRRRLEQSETSVRGG